MTTALSARLDRVLDTLPRSYPGPGGAVAVLRHGEVLVSHTWGWANAERRVPFTPHTLFQMCSITKQFTCALVLDAFPDPSSLDGDVAARLSLLEETAPGVLHLCHNQSGLRDYWALAMLQGSPAEAPFGNAETSRIIGSTRTLQFSPGTRYSYSNGNFRLLSDVLQERTGRTFAEMLRTRIFDRTGMETAFLAADTSAMPDGTQGYEGTQATGFRAAENRVLWTGDAGLGASLDDMIAWERHVDATRDEADSLYGRLAIPTTFCGGVPAEYGFGLNRRPELGHPTTGHGGALRGWCSHRLYVRSERVSVVVLFNHLNSANKAAVDLLAAVLDQERPEPDAALPSPVWVGSYIEPETGLAVRIDPGVAGQVRLRFGPAAEQLDLQADDTAGSTGTRLCQNGDGLWIERRGDNLTSRLVPCEGVPARDIAGRYRCEELEAELTLSDAGRVFYGAFSGFLGQGRMEMLEPVGSDMWVLPCPRALDHSPPGDWTIAVRRGESGQVLGVDVGCWLARRLSYRLVG